MKKYREWNITDPFSRALRSIRVNGASIYSRREGSKGYKSHCSKSVLKCVSGVEVLGAYLTYLLGLRPRPRRGPAHGPPESLSQKVDFFGTHARTNGTGSFVNNNLLQPKRVPF